MAHGPRSSADNTVLRVRLRCRLVLSDASQNVHQNAEGVLVPAEASPSFEHGLIPSDTRIPVLPVSSSESLPVRTLLMRDVCASPTGLRQAVLRHAVELHGAKDRASQSAILHFRRNGITQAFIDQEMADLKHYALAKPITEAVSKRQARAEFLLSGRPRVRPSGSLAT